MPRLIRPLTRSAAIVLAATLATSLAVEARAAGLKAVILTQPPNRPGITPVGDPVYIYSFAAYLQPGYGLRFFDTTITIEGLVGVPVPTGTSTPTYPAAGDPLSGTGWTADAAPNPTTPTAEWPTAFNPGEDPPIVPVSDVTFTFIQKAANGGPVDVPDVPGADPLYLGIFQVYTENLPFLPDPYSFTFRYVINAYSLELGQMVTTDGFVTLSTAVPEPGSLLMMAMGVAAPIAWAARRRRRATA